MSTFAITADQLAAFRSSVVAAVAGCENERCYEGFLRTDFALGAVAFTRDFREGKADCLVLADAEVNKPLLLLSEREAADQVAALLNRELQQLDIGPSCYAEAASVRKRSETVQKGFIFSKKKVEFSPKVFMLHVFLCW